MSLMTLRHDLEPERSPPEGTPVDRRRFLKLGVAAAPWLWGGMSPGSATARAPPRRSAFFPEAAASHLGFYVTGGPAACFLSSFEALGGRAIVVRPIGRPFTAPQDGALCQPFERMLLRWNEQAGYAEPAALLDDLHRRGLDRVLSSRHGVPVVSRRALPGPQGNPEIAAYYTNYGGAETFGYARSGPETVGESIVQRFQNAALRRAMLPTQEGPPGSAVAPLAVGAYARDFGVYPSGSLVPEALRIVRFEAPVVVRRGDPAEPFIYLTVDDCWTPEPVERALDIAAATGVKLTFFPVGAYPKDVPQLWRRAVAEGHAVENHTQTHRKLSELSDAQIHWEIEAQRDTLKEVLGFRYRQHFLRPPIGDGIFNYQARIPLIAQQLGYKIAMWSCDSDGYIFRQRTDQWAVDQVYAALEPHLVAGAVVLQHSLPAEVAALPQLIAGAQERGLHCLSMPAGIV